jgi:hypothetical protein
MQTAVNILYFQEVLYAKLGPFVNIHLMYLVSCRVGQALP